MSDKPENQSRKLIFAFAESRYLLACGRLLIPTLLLATLHPANADWPSVRGPEFDGHSHELEIAEEWPADGPPVLWIRKLGQGYSAFVASGDRIYTQAQNMTGQFVYCLEADTGETIWEYRYDWPYEAAGVYPGPRSTPTLFNNRVYATSPDGLLICLSQTNGNLIWSVQLEDRYGIKGCDFGYACSPTLVDDLVILPVGGENAGVVALSADSGTEIWTSTSDPASYTPAYPVELNGRPLVVCYMHNSLLILDRASGVLLHRKELSSGYDEHSAWPIYQEPYLWLSGPFRAGSYVLDISTVADGNPVDAPLPVLWRSKKLSNDVCSSICIDGHVFGFDIFDVQSKTHRPSRGIFRCVNINTGEETWSVGTGRPRRASNADEFAGDIGQSGMIAADGKLIILNELGELILLRADTEKCMELARCTVLGGELTWTPPCLHRGRLYVRNQSRAVCVYLGRSKEIIQSAAQSVADLPQRQYHNLAALILAVEPEYAFDVPHDRWLVEWFLAGISMVVLGIVLANRKQSPEGTARKRSWHEFLIMFILGAAGTTLFGRITGEFVFTWPVCLYAAFEFVIRPASTRGAENFFTKRIPLLVFLTTSIAYFLICRRLSLVFEWAFLVGFVSALPIAWLLLRKFETLNSRLIGRVVTAVTGFACFYAGAVVFLKSRY